ncbi:MAG TPA: hypothetical protein VMZ69_03630 [Saprospiraceae bacterium]|nr:hypothetical protein [Saprospiraceae bacterium]
MDPTSAYESRVLRGTPEKQLAIFKHSLGHTNNTLTFTYHHIFIETNSFMYCTQHHLLIFLFIFFAFVFLSCGSARIRSLQLTAKEPSPPMFIKTKNLEVIPVSDFSLIRYNRDSLIALQTENNFRRLDGDEDYVRLIKGPMNLYYLYNQYTTTSFHGPSSANPSGMSTLQRTSISRYFDLGLDKPLIYFDRESIEKHTVGCNPCLAELKKYDRNRKSLTWWKYANWTALAGGLVIGLTGDTNVSDDGDFRIYGFAGLLVGGLSSELYRMSRVGRNEARLEEVVDEYNKFKY